MDPVVAGGLMMMMILMMHVAYCRSRMMRTRMMRTMMILVICNDDEAVEMETKMQVPRV